MCKGSMKEKCMFIRGDEEDGRRESKEGTGPTGNNGFHEAQNGVKGRPCGPKKLVWRDGSLREVIEVCTIIRFMFFKFPFDSNADNRLEVGLKWVKVDQLRGCYSNPLERS